MNFSIEKLESLEKAGVLTHDLRQELSRLRREKELEIQLAAAEKKAQEKAAAASKTKVTATLEPHSKDDVAVLSIWSHPHSRLLSDAKREIWLSDSSVSFFSKELYAELKPLLMRLSSERFPVMAVVENWDAHLSDPAALIAARVRPTIERNPGGYRPGPQEPDAQHISHLINNCRSIPIVSLWSATSHAAKVRLARLGTPHPPELEGSGWDAIQHWRALEQRKAYDLAKEKARLEKHQASQFAAAQEREELRAKTREAARAAYHATIALEQAENVTPKRTRKTTNKHTSVTE